MLRHVDWYTVNWVVEQCLALRINPYPANVEKMVSS